MYARHYEGRSEHQPSYDVLSDPEIVSLTFLFTTICANSPRCRTSAVLSVHENIHTLCAANNPF